MTLATRPSHPALLGWALFVLLLLYAWLLGGTYVGIQSVALRTFSLVLITAALAGWAVLAWRRPGWRPKTAIWPALLLPLVALTLSTLLSPFPRLGLEYVAWATLLVALYLLLVRIMGIPLARAWVGGVAAVIGLTSGLVYIALVVGRWIEWWELLGRLTAPMLRPAYQGLFLNGPTLVAPVLILSAAVALGGTRLERRSRRWLLVSLAVVTLVAVLLTGSRASWLGLAVALLVVGLGLAIQERAAIGIALRDRRIRRGLAALAVAGVIGIVVMAPALGQRLDSSGDGGRGAYVTTALRMFEDAPVVGQGPGTWAPRRLAYTEAGELDFIVPHAHNAYAQTLAETGMVGAIAGLAAIAAVLWLLIGGIRARDAGRRRWSWASLFGLVYLGMTSLLDSYANVPLVLLLAAIPLAVVDATSASSIGLPLTRSGTPAARRAHALGVGLVFGAAALAAIVLFRVEAIAATHERAVMAANDGDWDVAAAAAAWAATDDPEMPVYEVTRGLAAAAIEDWTAAEEAFAAAARIDDQPQTWLGLASARLELGRPAAEVQTAIERALRIGEQGPGLLLAAGFLYDRLGMIEEADAAYSQALVAEPSLAADPAWRGRLTTDARFNELLDAAIARSDAPWELALMTSQFDFARELAAGTSDAEWAGIVIDAWAGTGSALSELQDAALADPASAELVTWAARSSAKVGDAAAAERFRRIAAFDNESREALGYEARIVGVGDHAVAGIQPTGHLYGSFLYRRPTPDDLLATGLPGLVLVDLADDR